MTDIFDLFTDIALPEYESPQDTISETPYEDRVSIEAAPGDNLFAAESTDPRDVEEAAVLANDLSNSPLSDYISNELIAGALDNAIGDNLASDQVSPFLEPLHSLGAEAQPNLDTNQIDASEMWDKIVDFMKDIADFIMDPFESEDALVRPGEFSSDGKFDSKNGLIVVGDVAEDIQYVDQQNGPTCSLMAQEQFVNRYIGKSLPEDYLAWRGEEWGVYSPSGPMAGTNDVGQTSILDHFNIPYERGVFNWFNTPDSIERELDAGKDLIVGVDARAFYGDPTIPPGVGHAVAVVGKGVDPATNETAGFYITDSNHPGTARFMDIESFDTAWQRDMISIPTPTRGLA